MVFSHENEEDKKYIRIIQNRRPSLEIMEAIAHEYGRAMVYLNKKELDEVRHSLEKIRNGIDKLWDKMKRDIREEDKCSSG